MCVSWYRRHLSRIAFCTLQTNSLLRAAWIISMCLCLGVVFTQRCYKGCQVVLDQRGTQPLIMMHNTHIHSPTYVYTHVNKTLKYWSSYGKFT